jgi:hypothetical protein
VTSPRPPRGRRLPQRLKRTTPVAPVEPTRIYERVTAKAGQYDGPTGSEDREAEARKLARAPVPLIYRNNPAAIYVLLYRAQALNIPVATAFEGIHLNLSVGKGALTSQLAAALLTRAGIRFQVICETTERVAMVFYDGKRKLGTVEWRYVEAIGAGLAWRHTWQAYPTDMLWARCLMRGMRRYAQHVGTGLAYTAEELHDMAIEDGADGSLISTDVQTIIDEATTEGTTADQIKDEITPRARRAKLLEEDAGDGKTLGLVLGELWMAARSREVDETLAADYPMPGRAAPADAVELDEPVDDRPAGTGSMPCGCTYAAWFATGAHEEGCRA